MLQQTCQFEQTQNRFSQIFSLLTVKQLLRKAEIRKSYGVSSFYVFQILFQLVFHGKNLFRSLESKHAESLPSKDVFYRFLNETKYNWRRFYQSLSAKVVNKINALGAVSQKKNRY